MGLLDGKVAIITGGGKGIGFGIASAFAEQGAKLFITGRTEGRLADAAEKLTAEYGAEVAYAVAEGSDEAQVEAAIAKCVEHFGKLDVMVNNAQASKSGTNLIDHTKEDFDLAINTGLYGAFFYMKHAFPELKKTKGCVINLASGAGLFGKPGQSSYAAAKEGIRGMTRVAATEWGPDGVRANCICPLAMTAGTLRRPEDRYRRRGGVPRERPFGLRFRRNYHRARRQRPAPVDVTRDIRMRAAPPMSHQGEACASPFFLQENASYARTW